MKFLFWSSLSDAYSLNSPQILIHLSRHLIPPPATNFDNRRKIQKKKRLSLWKINIERQRNITLRRQWAKQKLLINQRWFRQLRKYEEKKKKPCSFGYIFSWLTWLINERDVIHISVHVILILMNTNLQLEFFIFLLFKTCIYLEKSPSLCIVIFTILHKLKAQSSVSVKHWLTYWTATS